MKKESIIKLRSEIVEHVWGGTKIRDVLKKDVGNKDHIAESWEVSTHPSAQTIIDDGVYAGKTLVEYFDTVGWDKLGEYGKKYRQLPILVKYIDAKNNLSIQVHPDDEYAKKIGQPNGKNELWFVLGAAKNAFIYLGFKNNVTKEEVLQSIADNTLEKLLNKIRVKKGETYYIPAGTVHAIGAGCLICEIQQTSNETYRLYDYGRLGIDNKPRELHVYRALEVLNLKKFNIDDHIVFNIETLGTKLGEILGSYNELNIFHYKAEGEFAFMSGNDNLFIALAYSGKGKITCDGTEQNVKTGDTLILNGKAVSVTGNSKVLIIKL